LMGWDIGAGGPAEDLGAFQRIARVCAWWTLAAGAVVTLVRLVRYQDRWFWLSGAALLHVTLHGLFHLSYLRAGVIAGAIAFVAVVATYLMGSHANRSPEG
jgi:hypothetical protein